MIVTKADKGNTTVIIKHTDCIRKMENLLKDETYYKIVTTNPLTDLQKATGRLYKNLNNFNIFQNKKAQITLNKTNLSKGYGLIKIHKIDFLLRPIISAINSPVYNLSKFFAKFLQNYLTL